MSELSKRVAVAAVAIPIVLGLVYLGGWFVALPLAAFAGLGAHEMFRFARQKGTHPIEPVGVASSGLFVILAGWQPSFAAFAPWALGLLVATGLAASLEAMRTRGPGGHPLASAAITVFAPVYVGLALSFVLLLLELPMARASTGGVRDPIAALSVVTLPLAVTWIGDAAAYFAGSAWGRGRARLAPTISPNKSWVGFWANLAGGALAAMAWVVIAGPWVPQLAEAGVAAFGALGALLGLAAVVGDLLESLFKREAGVKDSGSFFPGHGGVLDRIDSLVLTIPGAYALLVLVAAVS